ncbi:hypothetical protein EC9_15580 [Rosistilla ulvae]|uniref:DUF1552 domain-containing protein n=2 Tax=Rosistilla ulvae TaxID=1930277 RepID=A0A517LXP4_9BACT|nr:hypothetical protein EC9_15580 [Rosistilla ulvae]
MRRMNTHATTLNRRTLLRGLGTAIALPLLDAMSPTRCLTAAAAPTNTAIPMRLAFLYVPNGMHMPDWKPSKEGSDYELPRTLKELAAHRSDFNVMTGLALKGAEAQGDGGGDHARSVAAFLTGAHPKKTDGANIQNGVSVDQVAADAIGSATRFASLELGLENSAQAGTCDSGYSCAYSSNMSWRNATSPVAKEIDPAKVFDRLFGHGDGGAVREARATRHKYRKSVLDFALQEANQLKDQLGVLDRRKLDEYLYSVRSIERRIVGTDKLDATEEGVPDYPRPAGVPREMQKHADLMLDMMTLAMQTDSTRVISFMFTNAGSNRGYPELEVREGHHELSHHGKSEEKQTKIATINRFYAQRFAYFLERLKQVPEGDGTLLDHSAIVYGSGISDGDRHNHDDLPILLAGRAGGRIQTGRHIVYPKKTPLCNLYLWMLQQAGAPSESFGDSNGVIDRLS